MSSPHTSSERPLLAARWLAWFGPGAIVASLTIGAGELVFSTRGGALFGYRLLGLFLLICVFKWALVLTTARHIVLTGAHPFQRWMDCPGPRGWLPILFLLIACFAFPIWVGFHAGTVGTLVSALTNTTGDAGGGSHFLWGAVALLLVMVLCWSGGYRRLERVQLMVVFCMLVAISYSLLLLRPNLLQMLREGLTPFGLRYPDWVGQYPRVAARPLWVELATYVGVVGGSGYDYLAYASFLRDKRWGVADGPVLSSEQVEAIARKPNHEVRDWLKAPLIDASISFLIVLFFSTVFLICGSEVLRPQQKIPADDNLLTLQAEFISMGTVNLRPVYFSGALLAMLGTLYGTIEVAPTVVRELSRCFGSRIAERRLFHRTVTGTVGLGGLLVLGYSLTVFRQSGSERPTSLIEMLTPANLLTGVLACGIISSLSILSDRRHLPSALRPWRALHGLNAIGGLLFFAVGMKAFHDQADAMTIGVLLSFCLLSFIVAWWLGRHRPANGGAGK